MSLERTGIVEEGVRRRSIFERFIGRPAQAQPLEPKGKPPVIEPPSEPAPASPELLAEIARLREENGHLRLILARGRVPLTTGEVKVEQVMRAFCEVMALHGEKIEGQNWTLEHLRCTNRSRTFAAPRQVCVSLARRLCVRDSLPKISREFRRDHTTALHAMRRTPAILAADSRLAAVHKDVLAAFGVMEA